MVNNARRICFGGIVTAFDESSPFTSDATGAV